MEHSTERQQQFFGELSIVLQRKGYTALPEQDGTLPVELRGHPICQVTGHGGIRYKPADMESLELQQACDRVTELTGMTWEYMEHMEQAPTLKASGLSEDYKLLADFNGTVLAGHPTQFGTQFVTWDWNYDRTALCHGHYFGFEYREAKEDFATRSGLVAPNRLFNHEQLRCIGYAIDRTLDEDEYMEPETREHLERSSAQIGLFLANQECSAPELKDEFNLNNQTM